MIQLGNFIVICIGIIFYIIWGYYSIKDWIKCWDNHYKTQNLFTWYWNILTLITLGYLFSLLINYLNQYTIP